jgi:hypothetical protein
MSLLNIANISKLIDIDKYMTIIRCVMEKTKLLVIVITTAAIITAATTTSLSAATPAFAKVNCGTTVCSGGSGCGFAECTNPTDLPGGGGRHTTLESTGTSFSGGVGGQVGTLVGGGGFHRTCDALGCSVPVGGEGQHEKGPGGNSD